MDKNVWKNARKFFLFHGTDYEVYKLLPIINDRNQIICFAYEDIGANRELRMLRELQEEPKALQFPDIYPQYQRVKIFEFNELSYFFAKYLELQGIPVQLCGAMWSIFPENVGEDNGAHFLDHRCMSIYAEGVKEKGSNWMENLLRSVSVEFECIDIIYEENIKKGIIKDAVGDCEVFINRLSDAERVAVLGTDDKSQDTYDYLLQRGVEVCCFVSDGHGVMKSHLFGKPVISLREVVRKYGNNIVFIDCHEKNSAWGFGDTGVDYFDYLGYERNKKFYVLKDYMQLQGSGLKSVIKQQNVVLLGDIYLCEHIADYLKLNFYDYNQISYLNLSAEELTESTRLNVINVEKLKKDELCLIVMPEYMYRVNECVTKKKRIISHLDANEILNCSDYFSYVDPHINIEKEIKDKYPHEDLKIKRIVLGAIESCSGNALVRGLLDGHPSIMMMDYGFLSSNLFWICIRLSGRNADETIRLFEQLFCSENWDERLNDKDKEIFIQRLQMLLENGKCYTSQELFLIFFIAYTYMQRKNIVNVNDMIIYWEPHMLPRNILEKYTQWLGAKKLFCDILKVVRNTCMVNGSRIKGVLKLNWGQPSSAFYIALTRYSVGMDYNEGKKMVVKFENLKCNPREELQKLCVEWEIPWSDSLMTTTYRGNVHVYNNGEKGVKDFDLAPVFNNYEEYFSEFDRFRISLISAPWQKTYGYPYVDILLFSKRDLQEMFLIDFRFAEKVTFENEKCKLVFQIRLQNYIRQSLQKVRKYWLSNDAK